MVTIFQYFTHKSQLTRIKQSCELFPPESQNVNISIHTKKNRLNFKISPHKSILLASIESLLKFVLLEVHR